MINVGLIGFGLAGRSFHAPVIRAVPGLRLAAILKRSGDEAAKLYPDARIVRSVEELLAMSDIRLIVVATPNDTHHPIARQCLAAGRDVVVDKPLAPTLEEALDLVEFAQESGRLLTVYQNRRYDGDFQAVQQLVASGCLGRIVRFESNYDRFRPQLKANAWRERSEPGTGILFDLAPHLIDHALVLFGLPEAITADIRVEREHAVADDSFDLALRYAGALRALLRATMLAPVTRPRFILHGTNGAYVKHAFDVQAAKRSPRKPVSFHLKIDTGMNRLGIATSDVECFAGRLVKCKHLRLGGVMTHFASSEAFAPSPQGQQTLEQEQNFYAALDHLRNLGIDTGIVHMANSAAIAARPESWGDMVRPGVQIGRAHV